MSIRILFNVFIILVCWIGYASAGIVFTFQNENTALGGFFDGKSSGSSTVSGVQITAKANVGVFNATNSLFGINQPASLDDTAGFDFTQTAGPGVAENLTVSFDQLVRLNNIDVSSFGASDLIEVRVGGTLVATVSSTGTTSLGDFIVAANTDININTTAGIYGNGWSLDFIEASVVAVPEPTGVGVMGMLGVFVCGFKRRKRWTKYLASV